jgi:hypothetical protein
MKLETELSEAIIEIARVHEMENLDYTGYTDGDVLDVIYECVFGDEAISKYSVNELIIRLNEMYDAYYQKYH